MMKEPLFSEGLPTEVLIDVLRKIRSAKHKVVVLDALIALLEAIEAGREEQVPFGRAFDLVEAYMHLSRVRYPGSLQFRISREETMALEIPRLLLVDSFDKMFRILRGQVERVEVHFHLYVDDHGHHLSAKVHYGDRHLDEKAKETLSAVFEEFQRRLPDAFSRSLMIREDGLRLCLTSRKIGGISNPSDR